MIFEGVGIGQCFSGVVLGAGVGAGEGVGGGELPDVLDGAEVLSIFVDGAYDVAIEHQTGGASIVVEDEVAGMDVLLTRAASVPIED